MDPLQAGMLAAREGRQSEAQSLLKEALQANPNSEQGWLWMSSVVETEAERRLCLERVLAINPHNQTARMELDRLNAKSEQRTEGYPPVPGVGQPPGAQSDSWPSPHSRPTVGFERGPRPIRRIGPQSEPEDPIDRLRARQLPPSDAPVEATGKQSDPLMAMVLIGGLSITAIAGGVLLVALLLIGWPP